MVNDKLKRDLEFADQHPVQRPARQQPGRGRRSGQSQGRDHPAQPAPGQQQHRGPAGECRRLGPLVQRLRANVKIFADIDNTVGGTGGVDTPNAAGGGIEDDPGIDGYELDQSNNEWLWVRKTNVLFNGVVRPTVEFAFNYTKYNADVTGAGTRDFLPVDPILGLTYIEFDSTKGIQDAQNYLWNDKYDIDQAGSPNFNPSEGGGTGLGNIYQLDTLRFGALQAQGSISGEVARPRRRRRQGRRRAGLPNWQIYLDANANNVFDGGEPSTMTDASGNYTSPNLTPAPTTSGRSCRRTGSARPRPAPVSTPGVVVAYGQSVTGIDFGNFQKIAPSGVSTTT